MRRFYMIVGACMLCLYAFAQSEISCCNDVRTETECRKPFYMGLKSNMLFDALAVPNIGAEVYICENFTAGFQWMYAWWSHENSHRYWRIYGGDIFGRYWFGPAAKRKPMTGHHAGIYLGAFTFDFEWGGKAYMGGRPGHNIFNRCFINAGVEYGYSLPIAKHFNIDFTIGVGYIGGKMEKFNPEGDYYIWESTVRKTWIGPSKAEISLVWLIGKGNVNLRKGGERE